MISGGLLDHVWQSTLFAAFAAVLTWAFKKNHARVRYSIWLVASLKFLMPFALLVSIGERVEWRRASAGVEPRVAAIIQEVARPFPPLATPAPTSLPTGAHYPWTTLAMVIWLSGCALVLISWFRRWLRIRFAVRAASLIRRELPREFPIRVMQSPVLLEPGIFGIFRPILLLPEGIAERLTPAQLDAILAHELCHVRRRDNLAAAIHMMVEAAFWFHPLVWWIGARLVEERERGCDEEVLRSGSEPDVYAAGILEVCKLYFESPLACAAGVTGANLKQRIEQIMGARMGRDLNSPRKLMLAMASLIAIVGPFAMGLIHAPYARAQSREAAPLSFEVASIKPASPEIRFPRWSITPESGRLDTTTSVNGLIMFAYELKMEFQLSGGPAWANSDKYEVIAKAARPASSDELRRMLRTLLADRFKLSVRQETKELPVLELVVGNKGPKMQPTKFTSDGDSMIRISSGGHMLAQRAKMDIFANTLIGATHRLVLDRTNLSGAYDFTLDWTQEDQPDAGERPTIFSAVQEQLGLKLESVKAPVEVMVINHVERPAAN